MNPTTGLTTTIIRFKIKVIISLKDKNIGLGI
jgi:hypothetical protein